MHAPSVMLGNVVVDVEPFLVLTLGLRYPLHGYLHTFLAASMLGVALGYALFLVENSLRSLYRMLLLETDERLGSRRFIIGGVTGAVLHVLLDSPLYDDIRPLYPLTLNPFHDPSSSLYVYSICVWLFLLGLAYYVCILAYKVVKRLQQ